MKNLTHDKPEHQSARVETVHTGDLDKALDRIYRQYGNNLEAFFRDARNSILKRQEPAHDKGETHRP